MIEKYNEMKFSYAYDLAGFLREKVFRNIKEDYLLDIVMPTENLKILKPQKETILHDLIEWQFLDEIEYLTKKGEPDEIVLELTSLLTDYKIDYKNEDGFECKYEYVDYLEKLIKKEVAQKIANETFQLLFSDRMFCLKLNEIIANEINNWELKDHPEVLEKDGKPKRCTYFNVWVQKAVFLRDKGCCSVCLNDLSGLLKTNFNNAIDHIVPLNLGGINDITNFQLICQSCNLKKLGHTIITSEYYPTYF